MGIFDKLRGEFIDIIQWLDDSQDTMVWRFERYGNQIKNGAQLTVRESQVAVFVNEGQIADVFEPGRYELTTQNLPILSTLQGWKFGFNSPFVAEVYFVNTKRFRDLKWGTQNPLMMRDADFGLVRVRAFGTYEIKITDAQTFLKTVVGTDGDFTADEVTNQLRSLIQSRFADVIGEAKVPVMDLVGKYQTLGTYLTDKIAPSFAEYGINLTNFLIENISVPPEVEQAIDKRSSMGAVGNLQAYTQFQVADNLGNAGGGGTMGEAMGAGLGLAMAQQMAHQMQQNPNAAAPPPVPADLSYYVAENGQQTGPFGSAQLTEMARSGKLTGQSLVWKAGMAQWAAASTVAELTAVLGSVPPPLPPQ